MNALAERNRITERDSLVAIRRVVHRTRGANHGPITRLVSPSDLGELIKPFVFRDLFDSRRTKANRSASIPTPGSQRSLFYSAVPSSMKIPPARAACCLRAASNGCEPAAVFGTGVVLQISHIHGLQLWIALPPEFENAAPESQYVAPEDVPQDGPVSVMLGRYGAARSPVHAPDFVNYLQVKLEDGERWRYQPPAGHTVAWVFAYAGHIDGPEPVAAGELAVSDSVERL
jgi:hypothetical protein